MSIKELYNIYLQHPLILTDTRKIEAGGIFFALKGANFDGNSYASAALDAGALYAIVDDPSVVQDDRYIYTSNALQTLQDLAQYHRMQLDIPVIAITGSNGKTTTKELITAVLRKQYITYATVGNLNNHIGIPLTLLKIKQDAQIAIVEMGANHRNEIAGYCTIAKPTHAIITNCGKAHIEGFGGVEGVRKGKGELYDYIRENGGTIFRNNDLDYLAEMANGIQNQITYGAQNSTYTGQTLKTGMFLSLSFRSNDEDVVIDTNLVGMYNFASVMSAICVGRYFDINTQNIKAAIAEYQPDNSRSQWMEMGSNKIILDAYNANPSSMQAAIVNFANTDTPNKTLWIGGMKEMGDDENKEHKDLVSLINSYEWHNVILVGNEFKGIAHPYVWFAETIAAAAYIRENKPESSTILIKGSRGTKMELLLSALG